MEDHRISLLVTQTRVRLTCANLRYGVVTRIITALAACLLVVGPSGPKAVAAETYVVSPKATQNTKDAVAAGRAPEHGFPVIEDIKVSSGQFRPGQLVEGEVRTSGNVGYVEARVKNYNTPLRMTSLGHFALHYKVPLLPPFIIGRWTLQVIARSVDGVEVKRDLPIVYRY